MANYETAAMEGYCEGAARWKRRVGGRRGVVSGGENGFAGGLVFVGVGL